MDQSHTTKLLKDYFSSDPAPETAEAIDQWVREDASNARLLAELIMLDGMLLVDQKTIDARSILTVLAEDEQRATLSFDDVYDSPLTGHPARASKDKSITVREVFSVSGYLLGQVLTSKPAFKVYATAAVVLLAATLFFVFDGDETATDPAAGQSQAVESQPDPTGILTPTVVASLTAEHDAVWDRRPGQDLSPGQRYTLTQGFAEITTNRGAVVIIEAPATIQLLDQDNAIRLESGKLVGICETESSKGFLVRTSYLDVVDLGTRFGVDVSTSGETTVSVFEGEVEVHASASHTTANQPQRITAGQALTATASTLVETSFETAPFVSALNIATGMDDLRPRVEGPSVLWLGMSRDDMTTNRHESDLLQVYLERQGVVLISDVPVDTLPGESWPGDNGFGKAAVPAGTPVDVYLLHLDTLGNQFGREITVKCTIHFDRPILGLIGAQSTLRATDKAIGHPGTAYSDEPPTSRAVATGGGVGMDAPPFNDTAVLSADGRTLTLELTVTGGTDQARVLVQSRSAQP